MTKNIILQTREPVIQGVEVIFVDNNSLAEEVLKELRDPSRKVLLCDTESTGLDPYTSKLLLFQISIGNKTWVIDAGKVDIKLFKDILESESKLKVWQFFKHDYKFFKHHYNISIHNSFDTFIAERILTAGLSKGSANLPSLVFKYIGKKMYKDTREEFINHDGSFYTKEQIRYAADDASALAPIYIAQAKALQREELVHTALLEFKAIPAIAEMELYGVYLDSEDWKKMLEEVKVKYLEVDNKIRKQLAHTISHQNMFGYIDININSPKQLLDSLKVLGLDLENTNESTLKDYQFAHPVVADILDYRGLAKILNAYGTNLLTKIHPVTGRLHTEYKQLGAATGRLSSENPNLQQIPHNNIYRNAFKATAGKLILTADYSQQELRIAADASGDLVFIDMFLKKMDVHSRTAEFIFGEPWKKVYKKAKDPTDPEFERYRKYRDISKTTSFHILYGGSAFGLSKRLAIPFNEAKEIINKFYAALSQLKIYLDITAKKSLNCGYSITLGGRKRYLNIPKPGTPDYDKLLFRLNRISKNHVIQGTGADIMKEALAALYSEFKNKADTKLLLTVHDEIALECPEEESHKTAKIVEEIMCNAFTKFCKKVPIEIDISINPYWHKS